MVELEHKGICNWTLWSPGCVPPILVNHGHVLPPLASVCCWRADSKPPLGARPELGTHYRPSVNVSDVLFLCRISWIPSSMRLKEGSAHSGLQNHSKWFQNWEIPEVEVMNGVSRAEAGEETAVQQSQSQPQPDLDEPAAQHSLRGSNWKGP